MPINLELASFKVVSVYSHRVPDKASGRPLKLYDAASNCNDDTKTSIEKQVRRELGNTKLALTPLANPVGPVHGLISSVIHAGNGYDGPAKSELQVSRELAAELYKHQTGNSTKGMFLLAVGTCNDRPALCMIKVEDGTQIVSNERNIGNGQLALDLVEMPGPDFAKGEVLKCALFVADDSQDGKPAFCIRANDRQSGTISKPLADFFVTKFLECTSEIEPAVRTRVLLETLSDQFSKFDDPVTRNNALMSLQTEMDSNNLTMNYAQLVANVAPDDEAEDKVLSALSKKGFDGTQLTKDTSKVDDLKFTAVDLDNGIRIIGPKDKIFDLLKGSEDAPGMVQVQGYVLTTKPRARR
jgi:hypothetical protein